LEAVLDREDAGSLKMVLETGSPGGVVEVDIEMLVVVVVLLVLATRMLSLYEDMSYAKMKRLFDNPTGHRYSITNHDQRDIC